MPKPDPTKLLEEVASLRREQEARQRELEREKGALAQLLKDLKGHFGTSDVAKAKQLQRQEELEKKKLAKRFAKVKKRVRKEMDNA